MCEGETRESTCETKESTCGDTTCNSKKQSAESDIDLRDSQKMCEKQINYRELERSGKIIDYKELTEPLPGEAKAGIIEIIKEKVFMIIPDNDNCQSLCEAQQSVEWPE